MYAFMENRLHDTAAIIWFMVGFACILPYGIIYFSLCLFIGIFHLAKAVSNWIDDLHKENYKGIRHYIKTKLTENW